MSSNFQPTTSLRNDFVFSGAFEWNSTCTMLFGFLAISSWSPLLEGIEGMYRRGIKAWPEGLAKASLEFMEGLLLPRFLCFRPELRAPAFPAAGGPHGVPGVALHADHLVQPAMVGPGV